MPRRLASAAHQVLHLNAQAQRVADRQADHAAQRRARAQAEAQLGGVEHGAPGQQLDGQRDAEEVDQEHVGVLRHAHHLGAATCSACTRWGFLLRVLDQLLLLRPRLLLLLLQWLAACLRCTHAPVCAGRHLRSIASASAHLQQRPQLRLSDVPEHLVALDVGHIPALNQRSLGAMRTRNKRAARRRQRWQREHHTQPRPQHACVCVQRCSSSSAHLLRRHLALQLLLELLPLLVQHPVHCSVHVVGIGGRRRRLLLLLCAVGGRA